MNAITMDQAIANLLKSQGPSAEMRRIVVVTQSHTELFDAASTVLEWMRTLAPADRPIAKFNRLEDAINGVRAAHQLEPEDVR